jgi:Cytochrome c7 and related cytochrome c
MFILVSLAISFFAPSVTAQVVHRKSDFNHMKTGFPLTGVHTNVDCETCHVGGIFKGTPTTCAGCHSPGRSVVAPSKHANHLITNAPCETCHTNTVSFLGARFDHMGVQPRACMTCHNGGTFAPGKPAGHALTVASCDTCHRTSAWIPAGYDHIGVVPGSCINCHNGSVAIGKPSFHIATSAACDTCHHNFSTFFGAVFDHINSGAPITSGCVNCHGGQSLETKTKTSGVHIPTSAGCETCHSTSIFTSFAGASATMNHGIVAGARCDSCHNGSYISQGSKLGGAMAKISIGNHIPTTITGSLDCNTCHTGGTSNWSTVNMNHNGAITGCKTCHATGTPYNIPNKKAVTHDSSTATDCAQSGCHKPGAGGRGILYSVW